MHAVFKNTMACIQPCEPTSPPCSAPRHRPARLPSSHPTVSPVLLVSEQPLCPAGPIPAHQSGVSVPTLMSSTEAILTKSSTSVDAWACSMELWSSVVKKSRRLDCCCLPVLRLAAADGGACPWLAKRQRKAAGRRGLAAVWRSLPAAQTTIPAHHCGRGAHRQQRICHDVIGHCMHAASGAEALTLSP